MRVKLVLFNDFMERQCFVFDIVVENKSRRKNTKNYTFTLDRVFNDVKLCKLIKGYDQGRIKANVCPKHRPTLVPHTFHWHNVKTDTTH
jgi:hypothetical protein